MDQNTEGIISNIHPRLGNNNPHPPPPPPQYLNPFVLEKEITESNSLIKIWPVWIGCWGIMQPDKGARFRPRSIRHPRVGWCGRGAGYAPLVKLSAAPADELLAPLPRGLRGYRSLVVGTNCRDYSAASRGAGRPVWFLFVVSF